MRDLINVHSASRGSTAAGSPTVNDSASPLQGARPIPVPAILAGQDTSPSVSTSGYPLDLHGAQVQQKVPSLLLGEKEKTKAFNSPKPRVEQTYRYLLDAAHTLNPSRWKQSFALIVRHMPGEDEYGEFSSLRGQPSAPLKQPLTVNQADALVAAVAASGNETLLSPECKHDIDRLIKGYLQWRKEQSATTEPLGVSCCMQLLKILQREERSANSIEGDHGIHEYLAEIVSDKNTALSEAAKLEQQSPPLALFMYKLMEHIAPGSIASLGIDSKVLHKQPEVCALLAATLQERFEVAKALTKNGSEIAQLQRQLLKIDAYQLKRLLPRLLPLLLHDQAWTTRHLSHLIKEMDGHQLQYLPPLLKHDKAWTTEHLPLLKKMEGDQLRYLFPLLRYDKAWTTEHLPYIQNLPEDELYYLARLYFLKERDISLERFTSAANPYVREALSMHNRDIEEFTRILKTHGASRSTLHPEKTLASYLTEKFKHNHQQIPDATFGVENEMFIPGLPESHPSEIEHELNDRLGIKDKKYRYVKDGSLSTDAPFATPPIEQTTSILDAPEDIQRLQSALSILNDWGAFTNRTAGVHIHTGIKQWKAGNCLNTPEEKSKNRFLHQWDQDLPQQSPRTAITPYQLLFMKQFLVNMVSMQKEFYLVSRKSSHNQPNGPRSGNDLDKYYQDVSRARDYEELLSSANVDDRYFNVNLLAYEKYGTLEVRGFTKKNSDSMEVDPNLPIRDLIFMQEVLIKVLHDTKHILLSGASPDDPIEVRPSAGLTEIAQEYVQDVFLLEIIHALGQRDPEKRVNTMEVMVQDKDLMTSETLQKIWGSQAALLEGDPLAQHFLNALSRDTEWNPSSFVERTPLKRIHSLRSMADAGFSGHEQKP